MKSKTILLLLLLTCFLIYKFYKNNDWNISNLPIVQIPTRNSQMKNVRVVRVIDGDTIVCEINNSKQRVRLIGVDTPETVHPRRKGSDYYGKEASMYTKQVLENALVLLEFENELFDRYGRLLANVWSGGVNFQKDLLENGFAKAFPVLPNTKYRIEYANCEKNARRNGVGMWKH